MKRISTKETWSSSYELDVHDDDPKMTPEEEERRQRELLGPPLVMRAYHLPGYTWSQDLYQYLTNNHPVFGICLHHPLHPVGYKVRILSLIGSVMFGLAVTCIVYLAFVFTDTDFDTAYVEIRATNATLTGNEQVDDNVAVLSVTNGNIALWTVGAALHGFYDNTIWALAACTCCMEENGSGMTEKKMKRYQSLGTFLVLLSVVVATALATFAVALRAALDSSNDATGPTRIESDGQVHILQVDSAHDFEFIIAYCVELGLSYFVWYPLLGTVLFSGILGCGMCPILGGRPYEIMEEEKRNQKQESENGSATRDDDDVEQAATSSSSRHRLGEI